MNTEDEKVVETARTDGIAILPGLFAADELADIRRQFDQAYLDSGKSPGEPGTRDSISGEALLRYPALANLFIHPRILGIVSTIVGEDNPWLWQLKTNRYTPEHPGVRKHTDGFSGEISPPFTRQAMAVFLDDITISSGALTYVPGTHRHHYEDPTDPSRQAPTKEDIEVGKHPGGAQSRQRPLPPSRSLACRHPHTPSPPLRHGLLRGSRQGELGDGREDQRCQRKEGAAFSSRNPRRIPEDPLLLT